jgi:hypothetical protein
MIIVKNNNVLNFGYSGGVQMLTNFVFEILSVEYRDNLYGYFTIKLTKDNITFVQIDELSICGLNIASLRFKLLESGKYIFHPEITHAQLQDIFSYEFDRFKAKQTIIDLQTEQLAYGNQSAALEKSDGISFEDKKTLRSHYSTKQTQLQERINELAMQFAVIDPEIIVETTAGSL